MKLLRRGMALVLSVALVFSLVASVLVGVIAESNWGETISIGLLSRYYETGSTDSDPGIISTVPGDPGGKSYGVYMFASNPGTVKNFIDWCLTRDSSGAAYGIGERLLAAYKIDGYGSIFDTAWEYEADNDPDAFLSAQEGFVGTEIYDEALTFLRELGINLPAEYYSVALKNVIWSRAVHHGPRGAAYMIKRAFDKAFGAGGYVYQSEGDLIEAIYAESGRVVTESELRAELGSNYPSSGVDTMGGSLAAKYGISGKILRYWYGSSGDVQLSVYRRLNVYEVGDALTLLKNNAMPKNYQPAPGNYNISLQNSQQLYLQSSLVDSTATPALNTENAGKFTLEYLSGADAYTISTVVDVNGSPVTMRLEANNDGVVTLANPDDTDRQLWQIEQSSNNGYTVRNESAVYRSVAIDENTPTYLSYQDNTLKLVKPADAIPADGDTPAVAAVVPATWRFTSVVNDASDWTLRWVIAPQTSVNTINQGDSAFPVRGLLSCSGPISNVTLRITNESGSAVNYASKSVNLPSATYAFDLKELDSYISYSKLPQGTYKYVLSATANDKTFDKLVETEFKVGTPSSAPTVSERYTLTFNAGDHGTASYTSNTYTLDGQIYHSLPSVKENSGWRFVGWFTESDGKGDQIMATTKVVAADMTLYAYYTQLNSYIFLNASGGTFVVGSLAQTGSVAPGEEIPQPAENPVGKVGETFSHWVDEDGNKYYANDTIVMGTKNMLFMPVYTTSSGGDDGSGNGDNTGGNNSGGNNTGGGGGDNNTGGGGGGSTTTTPSGSLWTLSLGTSVSQMNGTVYSNGKVVTSGVLATGMTTTVDGKEYVISVKGDTSGDGKITVTDVVRLQSHLLNKSSLTGAYLKAADLNGDGKVTITDLVKAAHVVAGKSKIS